MIWPMEKSAACPRVFPTITSPARSVNQRSCRFRFSVLIPERAVPIPRRIVPDPPPPPSGSPSQVDSGGILVPVCIACNAGGFRHKPNQCSTISDTRVIPDPPGSLHSCRGPERQSLQPLPLPSQNRTVHYHTREQEQSMYFPGVS